MAQVLLSDLFLIFFCVAKGWNSGVSLESSEKARENLYRIGEDISGPFLVSLCRDYSLVERFFSLRIR